MNDYDRLKQAVTAYQAAQLALSSARAELKKAAHKACESPEISRGERQYAAQWIETLDRQKPQ
jgi:hypothetical protein